MQCYDNHYAATEVAIKNTDVQNEQCQWSDPTTIKRNLVTVIRNTEVATLFVATAGCLNVRTWLA